MTASRQLGEIRGIPESSLNVIDGIHNILNKFIKEAIEKDYPEVYVKHVISEHEFTLQRLWKFPLDETKHTWINRYLFKKQWVGRTFGCLETGEVFTVPYDVEETDFFSIGKGFLDVGRLNSYHRWSGIQEILKERT